MSSLISDNLNGNNSTPVGWRPYVATRIMLRFISESFPYPVTNPTDPVLAKPKTLLVEGWTFWLAQHSDRIQRSLVRLQNEVSLGDELLVRLGARSNIQQGPRATTYAHI